MTAITITARELTALLGPVTPHASKDDTVPLLCAVRIRSNGPWLTAIATDRYRIALKRIRPSAAPEEGFDAIIPLRVLARVRSIFKAGRGHDPILTFTIDGTRLTVGAADTFAGLVDASLAFELDSLGKWPYSLDRIVREGLTAEPVTKPAVGAFTPAFLADFATGQVGASPMRISPTGLGSKPWLVRIGDDFIGLIVPVRVSDTPSASDEDAWLPLLDAPEPEAKVA